MTDYAGPSPVPIALLRDTLAHEKQLLWRLEGQSMLPTLRPDSVITVHPLRRAARLGMIILFEQDGAVVAHRIVNKRAGGYITQGDNRLTPDRWVAPAQVIGEVVQATYKGASTYLNTNTPPIALFWLLRYHWLRGRRFIQRLAARTLQ